MPCFQELSVLCSVLLQLSESASTTQTGQQLERLMTAQLRKYRCPQCSFTSDKLFNVRRHINKKHTGQPVRCCRCHRMFRNEFYLRYDHKCPAKDGVLPSGGGVLLEELVAGIERTIDCSRDNSNVSGITERNVTAVDGVKTS